MNVDWCFGVWFRIVENLDRLMTLIFGFMGSWFDEICEGFGVWIL